MVGHVIRTWLLTMGKVLGIMNIYLECSINHLVWLVMGISAPRRLIDSLSEASSFDVFECRIPITSHTKWLILFYNEPNSN